jgi:hypothetical protein
MFVLTYVPQAAALAIFNGPLAFASTIMLVLSESSTLTNVLTRTFFIEDALIDTFDGVRLNLFSISRHFEIANPEPDPRFQEHDRYSLGRPPDAVRERLHCTIGQTR